MSHADQHYYEVVGSKGSDTGPYWWKVYHYDATGNNEVIVARSEAHFRTQDEAYDAAAEWLEDNNIQAEMA